MLKTVALDYIGDIKGGWKRVQGAEVFVAFFCYVWISIAWAPDFYGEGVKPFSPGLIFGSGVVTFIMLLGFLISRMYPGKLEKTLLLCPLTQEEKRRYIETGYWLRIALPMFFYLLAGLFWQIFGTVSLFSTVVIGVWMFFYLGCTNIYCLPEQGKNPYDRTYPVKGLEIFLSLVQILALGEIAGISFFTPLAGGLEIKSGIYGGTVTFLQILLYIVMRKKFYPTIMERALCYEDHH